MPNAHGFRTGSGHGWHDPSPVTGEHGTSEGTWQYCEANRALVRVQPETNPIATTRSAVRRNIYISKMSMHEETLIGSRLFRNGADELGRSASSNPTVILDRFIGRAICKASLLS